MKNSLVILIAIVSVTFAQRPSYAGINPIGFPIIEIPTSPDTLGNRFGDDATPTTTVRLPIEAQGNADLVTRLSKLPMDQQPFWLLNWSALEANRKNPQTYVQKPNIFIDNNIRTG